MKTFEGIVALVLAGHDVLLVADAVGTVCMFQVLPGALIRRDCFPTNLGSLQPTDFVRFIADESGYVSEIAAVSMEPLG